MERVGEERPVATEDRGPEPREEKDKDGKEEERWSGKDRREEFEEITPGKEPKLRVRL
jgi:hypothetical protein